MEVEVRVDTDRFKKSIDETRDRFDQAFAVSKNMIASMLKTAVEADIRSAGNFGEKYTVVSEPTEDGVLLTVDGPGVAVFENGGVIEGHPLLWLPISGTDAVGIPASEYGSALFSVNRKTGGVPLLFSIADHAPKYFGVPRVTISKKFHIAETRDKVMENFKDIFEGALNG